MTDESIQILTGLQAVREALISRRRPLYALNVARQSKVGDLAALAREAGIPVQEKTAAQMGQLTGSGKHQGVALECGPLPVLSLDDLLRFDPGGKSDLLLLLTAVEDPRNLGAVARCCSFLGARALLVTGSGTAPLSPAASRTSAGALESLPVAVVGSGPAACSRLARAGYEVVGVELGGEPMESFRPSGPKVALVLGGEDRGLGDRVRQACSAVVTIPGRGPTGSLNLSVAAGIALYHASAVLSGRGR